MEKPAILGGPTALQCSQAEFECSQSWPIFSGKESLRIESLFASGNISTHPIIREIESAYAQRMKRKFALAHNNGTSALMAAFFALDLKPGDQILVPTATFWASVVPMMWHGLIPVFCESEDKTLGLDVEDLKRKLNPNVKAMVIVPLCGIPSQYDELLAFAKMHGLKVIEDASHAHGALYKGRPIGSFGDISVFSLQGDKLAPAGEGGIFLTDNYAMWEKAVCMGDITRIIELDTAAQRFAATSFGIKTRMAPVSAAIGLEQLSQLDKRNHQRKHNLLRLSEVLEQYGFNTYQDSDGSERTYFEFLVRCLRTDQKTTKDLLTSEQWIRALSAEGCKVQQPRYPLLHEQPFFTEGAFRTILRINDAEMPDYAPGGFAQTRAINQSLIRFPSFPNEAETILQAYIEAIHKVGRHQADIQQFLQESD